MSTPVPSLSRVVTLPDEFDDLLAELSFIVTAGVLHMMIERHHSYELTHYFITRGLPDSGIVIDMRKELEKAANAAGGSYTVLFELYKRGQSMWRMRVLRPLPS